MLPQNVPFGGEGGWPFDRLRTGALRERVERLRAESREMGGVDGHLFSRAYARKRHEPRARNLREANHNIYLTIAAFARENFGVYFLEGDGTGVRPTCDKLIGLAPLVGREYIAVSQLR
jgi:hypothetical protein